MKKYCAIALTMALSCIFLANIRKARSEEVPAPELPPGVVIDKSWDFANLYVGSPSIEILPDGTYVASHDFFGSIENLDLRTHVFESKDKGQTWKLIAKIPNQRASYLFLLNDALYAIGWTPGEGFRDATKDSMCSVTINKSTDCGHTWTTHADYKSGHLIG